MSQSFDVIFRGDILPGHNFLEVKQRVGQLFKLDDERLNVLFSGKVSFLKRDTDRVTAEKYRDAMESAGAAVEIKSNSPQADKPAVSAAPSQPLREQEGDPGEAPNSAAEEVAPDDGAWSLAPAGSDVLMESERQRAEPVSVTTDHLGLAPEGTPVLKEEERVEIKATAIDTSHIALADE